MVVVADDDRMTRDYVGALLTAAGLKALLVGDGQSAIDAVRERKVDLVVLDVVMAGLSGIDACRVIKTITKESFVPVLLLTGRKDLSSRVRGLRTGADDYMSKPFEEAEFLARVQNMLRIKRAHDDVQIARSTLSSASIRDEVTTLPNHRYFNDRLAHEFKRAARYREPLACCLVALDEFRDLITEHGSRKTDAALRAVSIRIRETLRETDIAARFRTAEFGLLLPNTSLARAITMTDRLMSEIAAEPIGLPGNRRALRMSVGVGLFPATDVHSGEDLLSTASVAVARARSAGANRICVIQGMGYIFSPKLSPAA